MHGGRGAFAISFFVLFFKWRAEWALHVFIAAEVVAHRFYNKFRGTTAPFHQLGRAFERE